MLTSVLFFLPILRCLHFCASFTLNANWVEVPLNQLSDRFKRLLARVQSNYFLAAEICENEKYVAAAVDYQILDQKLTGPPVTTHCNIKFGQIFKLLITLHSSIWFFHLDLF